MPTLSSLPDEILHLIFRFVHPNDAMSVQCTARRFRDVANEPLLWRFYCQTYFRYWDERHEFEKKLAARTSSVDWKRLYLTRAATDATTTKLLDGILSSQSGRIEKFEEIISLGYDVKDTLLRHARAGPELEDHLARRYYSNAVLGCLHRNIAIPQWVALANGEDVPLERALGAFDMFIPETQIGSLDEITAMLDEIVTGISEAVPSMESLSPRAKALKIASYLRSHNLTGIKHDKQYHDLDHNFIGFALKDPEHNSLPLISAAIYCYVAQRFGLNARPCGFPFHVHVIITPEPNFDMDGRPLRGNSEGEPMYMDPFRSDRETPVSDLRQQLNFLGGSVVELSNFLGASLTSEIVVRCSQNIRNSIHLMAQFPRFASPIDVVSARYASLWAIMLCGPGTRAVLLHDHLPALMELLATDFPSDLFLIERYILPLFEDFVEYDHLRESLHVMRAVDKMPKQPRFRRPGHKHVRYHVGDVFRHRRYNYRAVITGWDTECGAGEQWMQRMGVDRLPRGRHQSFYHALVEDRSMRYVAEENIEIIRPSVSELPAGFVAIAGKHFKRWDETAKKFVSNIRDEYPDD
ncbi:hypothetical protein VTN49DRAFT_1542 [Thermomyces lanuginosus]|uniref:uncharacterized protein n=1 Tax=Thermomyces lanuginosus TaxID=5541 RepID=UPI003743B56F